VSVAWPARPAIAAADTTFSGRATVISGQVEGTTIGPLADTGDVSASGGHLDATVLTYPIPGVTDPTNGALSAEVLQAVVIAHGNHSHAEATVASFSLTAAGQTVGASFLSATADATCNGTTASVAGSAQIVDLTLNRQPLVVSGGVGPQTITLPGLGAIVINEQVGSASANSGTITVNALHVMLTDPATGKRTDVVVASAHADIACGTNVALCADQDFVTGGGWITTSSGSRANFAVAAGKTAGWGHLMYIDHGAGLKVKGTGVTMYTPGPTSTARHIEGTDEANGAPGTYQVDVADNGEPGRDDTFRIWLSNGYTQGPVTLSGGNIQLHCR
jgi:hypothetical protein